MTSRTRINVQKPGPSSSQTPSLPHQSIPLDKLSDSLVALDAPSITKTDLARLYKGRLGDALSFASEHVKGRKEVAIARNHIHKLRETSRAKSALKAPSGSIELELARSPTDKAASRLSSAKKAVETYQRQINERLTSLAESQSELEKLQHKLKEKHRVALLLEVLHKKESIRVKRFEEISSLLNTLKKTNTAPPISASSEDTLQPNFGLDLKLGTVYSHTIDTITTLRAYHVRLARIVSSNPRHSPGHSSESKLRETIRRRVSDDEQMEADLTRALSAARLTARERTSCHSSLEHSEVSKLDLTRTMQANKTKEQLLQNLSDSSIAFGFLCDHFIRAISSFIEQTSYTLKLSLEEEASQATGYVDALCKDIFRSAPLGDKTGNGFAHQIQVLCLMPGSSLAAILQNLERMIISTHARASFVGTALNPPLISTEEAAMIAKNQALVESSRERTVKFLQRKIEKVEVGHSLAKDAENLLHELEFITSVSKSKN